MKVSTLLTRIALAFFVLGISHAQWAVAKNVLMISDVNAAWHNDSEVELSNYLQSIGYTVTIQHVGDINQNAEAQIDLARQADVVYLADSIGSVTVSEGDFEGSTFFMGELDVPIISQEAYMWDEALWVSRDRFTDFGDTFQAVDPDLVGAYTDLTIKDPTHPLAAGLSGNVEVYTDPYGYNFGNIPTMGKGVKVIATVPNNPDAAALFVYEKGSELVGGTKTPGMRIGMYIGQGVAREEFGGDLTNNRFDRLTQNGKKLIKAAFDYATGSGGIAGDFNNDGQLNASDIDDLSAQVRGGTNPAKYNLNGDAVVNGDDRDVWVNTLRKTYYGDSNLDGEFNSGDFVFVFGGGQYEDGVANNSTWASGDWNGDREFDSSDFVTAFGAGGYELGPRAAIAAVPEPATSCLIVLGLGALAWRRRQR